MYAVKIYLNEVGWDGEPYFAYFETEELAEQAMTLLDAKWKTDEDIDKDVYTLDLWVVNVEKPAFDPETWAEDTYKELWAEVADHEGWEPVAT